MCTEDARPGLERPHPDEDRLLHRIQQRCAFHSQLPRTIRRQPPRIPTRHRLCGITSPRPPLSRPAIEGLLRSPQSPGGWEERRNKEISGSSAAAGYEHFLGGVVEDCFLLLEFEAFG